MHYHKKTSLRRARRLARNHPRQHSMGNLSHNTGSFNHVMKGIGSAAREYPCPQLYGARS